MDCRGTVRSHVWLYMPSEATRRRDPRQIGFLLCAVVTLALLGTTGVLASAEVGPDRATAEPIDQDDPRVTITSPDDGATFAHADIVRIDLAFEDTDTAVLTLENVTNAGPDPVTFHVTVEDANGSGTATVYFNPFQAFDGPVTDCDPDVQFADCDDVVVPDNHRNHGFFTHPEDDGSALIGTDRPPAVRYAPRTTERAGGSAGEHVLPANVNYELSVSAGTRVDQQHTQSPDDGKQFRLRGIGDCGLDVLAASSVGPEGIDPSDLDSYGDVESLLESEAVVPPRDGRYVEIDEYVVIDLRASGLEGIFHEATRQGNHRSEAALLERDVFPTRAFETAAQRATGGSSAFRMVFETSSTSSLRPGSGVSIEHVVAGTDDRGHYDRYAVVLRFDAGPRGDDARLSPGTEVSGELTVSTLGFNYDPAVIRDGSDRPKPALLCQADTDEWTFFRADESAPISAGFISPSTPMGADENITFNGLRSDGIVGTYEWEFGDGATATGRSVEHAYDEPGMYTVELTVSGPAGNDTATETVIVVEDADDPLPVANVSVDEPQAGPEVGTELAFEAATDAPAELIEGYRWEFDDGTTAVGPTASHSYDEPGEYVVNVTVIGVAGENTTRRTVVVEEASPPSVSIDGKAEDGQIALRANSSGGAIDRYGWDLGDGTSLNGDTVTHTYDEPGEYSVELLVTGPGGTDTATVTVRAEEGAEAADGDGADLRVTIPEGASGGTDADDGLGHGFGIVAAIAALAGAATLFLRRR